MNLIARTTYFATVTAWIAILLPFTYVLMTGDFPGPVGFYGLTEDDQLVDFIFDLREAL